MKEAGSGRGMTLTEKILLQHALGPARGGVRPGQALSIAVDWTLASEIAWKGMNETYGALGRPPLFDRDRFYLALDHTVDRRSLAGDPRTRELVQLSRRFAREAGLTYFYDANTTIMHTEFYRQLVLPGEVVIGADSHTSSHGGMGAFAIGLGGADVVAAMVQGATWVQVPEAIRVHFRGRLPFGLTGKDLILRTLGELGRNTIAMERTVEYSADHLEDLSTDFRFTIANMTAELGGLNGIFSADGMTRRTLAMRRDHAFRDGGWWFAADRNAVYAESRQIDLDPLAPQVAAPSSPDNVRPVQEAAGQALDGCFIGACTTSEHELILAALILEQSLAVQRSPPVATPNRLLVPGSLEITERLQRFGLLVVYRQAGFRVGEPGCSMCIGIASDRARPGEVWLSSQNRNFPNRMGPGSIAWLASALTVAASAAAMEIADPRPFIANLDRDRLARLVGAREGLPPVVRSEPQAPDRPADATAEPAAEDAGEAAGALIRGRVQRFGDHVDTDAIIPGEFCHLTRLDELGAKAFVHYRPDFRRKVKEGQNVLVAGAGWGTGSSREQAVWALKGAGVKAIIARSFAYIHQRNLVNEALPFLVIADPAFFAAVADGDPIEVDLAAATVTLGDGSYPAAPLPPPMRRIIASGGLVRYLRHRLRGNPHASQ